MEGVTTLQTLLDWVIRLGAMYLAFRLTEWLDWPVDSEIRRYVAFTIASALGLCAWGVGIEFGYIAQPAADWHAWVEGAAGVVLTIILGAQITHARVILSGQDHE